MAKFQTPKLDGLEGPWLSFVSDIKAEAEHAPKTRKNLDYQIPADCLEDLLGLMELSYNEKPTGNTAASWACSVTAAALSAVIATSPKCSPASRLSIPCVWRSLPANTTAASFCAPLRHLGSARLRPHQHARIDRRHRVLGTQTPAGGNLLAADPRHEKRPRRLRFQPAHAFGLSLGIAAANSPATNTRDIATS